MTTGKSILIVDDDWGIRTFLSKFLTRQGYEVHLAEDGMEGLRLAKSLHPDLLILDVRLPGMDGLTVARMLRAYKPIQKTPIMMLTVMDQEEAIKKAEGLGILAYVIKPFRASRLIEVVKEILPLPDHLAGQ